MFRHNVKAARELRQRMTPAETRLWDVLRDRRLDGLKVRRQHPVGPYVLDFAIPAARLGVELDGSIHDAQQAEDAARATNLAELGWRLLRFSNDAVIHDLGAVLETIRREALTPSLSPIAMGEASTSRKARGEGEDEPLPP
jgi:very-short-patch-repair endonuclease